MANLSHYSPEDVTVLFAGVHQISGFVSGTFISISKDVPTFRSYESADGVSSRQYKNSNLFTVTINLANTSESNDVLSYAARLDEVTKKGKFPLLIKDQMGSSLFFASSCWIESLPNADFSDEIESRQWNLKCIATLHLGGNESPSGLGQDALNVALGLVGGVL